MPQQYLTFLLGRDEHGIPASAVIEILPVGAITHLPTPFPWLLGVVNVRGAALPVLDLARRFGLPPTVVGKRSCVLFVCLPTDGEHLSVGLLVDAVCRVLDVGDPEIHPPPAFGNRIEGRFLRGMVHLSDRFVVLLDDRALLDTEEVHAVIGRNETRAEPEEAPIPEEKGVFFFDDLP